MAHRVINFNPGPATLPLPALEAVHRDMLDFNDTGISILEHSHRGKHYDALHNQTIALIRQLFSVPDSYDVLFMSGGASAQFAMVPMNLIPKGGSADYILTGSWSKKAYAEAQIVATARLAADMARDGKFLRCPGPKEVAVDPAAAYLHITSNNTIAGTQYFDFPESGKVPLVADMSSDIMWRPLDVSRFGLIYAGAQKNLGPAGVTLVIVRKELVEKSNSDIPKAFSYQNTAKGNSLQNTAPTFNIFVVNKVVQAYQQIGGLVAIEKLNREKAALLYELIDANADYFRCPVDKGSRSVMNVVFRLPEEKLETAFIEQAKNAGMVGLKGHRSVGGCRASIYNAMTLAGVERLVQFMADFKKANPA